LVDRKKKRKDWLISRIRLSQGKGKKGKSFNSTDLSPSRGKKGDPLKGEKGKEEETALLSIVRKRRRKNETKQHFPYSQSAVKGKKK